MLIGAGSKTNKKAPEGKGKHKPHQVSFPGTVRELSPRSLNIILCCITLGLSLAMLAFLIFSVSTRCEQIFREDGGQYDCGVGIGWGVVGIAFVGIAGYSVYRLYELWREGMEKGEMNATIMENNPGQKL